jgi:hypothetical protein
MALRTVRFLSILLVTLILGLAFCHVMEIPGKLRLGAVEWLAVQQNLYVAFGAPLGASIELLSIAATWMLVAMVRRRRPAFWWTLGAAICVTAGLAAWFALVAPMNGVLAGWSAQSIPAEWKDVRNRWEIGHAVHAALFFLGFSGLVIAMLAETPDRVSGRDGRP